MQTIFSLEICLHLFRQLRDKHNNRPISMYSIKILPIFVRIITSQTIMKRFYTHLFPIFFVTLWLTFGCGEKKSERAGGDSAVGAESQAQKASPLRSAQGKIGTAVVKVQYGSPAVRNRVVWGD